VAAADEHPPENPLFTAENKWRATRHGLDARFHDFSTGRSANARESARDLVDRLCPISQVLGCEAELGGVLEIAEGETGADRQRAVFQKRRSTKDVVARLVAETA
jgi:glutamate---cysteine ligase / carboxylate-amine ligase